MKEELLLTFAPSSLLTAFYRGLQKLNPLRLWRSPVIFLTEICAIVTTLDIFLGPKPVGSFRVEICLGLWMIVLVANTAGSLAEIRNEIWTSLLRKKRSEILASRYDPEGNLNVVDQSELKRGDLILIRKGETIPADGEIISGSALIDESSLSGNKQYILRKALSKTKAVTGGTQVISDQIVVRVTANPGEGSIDQMLKQIESSKQEKTLGEITLAILLSSLTIICLIVVVSNQLFARYYNVQLNVSMQIAMLTCLIPTTIASLLYAIEIAGINRLMKKRVIARNPQSIEIAGKIDVILLDESALKEDEGTVVSFIPAEGVEEKEFLRACYLCFFSEQTKVAQNVILWIKEYFPFVCALQKKPYEIYVGNSTINGIDIGSKQLRKGSQSAIEHFLQTTLSGDLSMHIQSIAKEADTPIVIADQTKPLGIIHLQNTLKEGLTHWFEEFKYLGVKTILFSAGYPLTTEALAKKMGADEFLITPTKQSIQQCITELQNQGNLVAITGNDLEDVPCFLQADLSIAMNQGAQPAKKAANMIDLDSNPIKLFSVVEIGKQLLMTRGALTAFSIANDLAKYFIIIPSVLYMSISDFKLFNILNLSSAKNAVLSAVIFNAVSLVLLIPLALKGIKIARHKMKWILNRHLLVYGLGGLIAPIFGIKIIDQILLYCGISGG